MINGNTFSDPGQVIKTLRALESLIKKVNFATNPLYGLSWISLSLAVRLSDLLSFSSLLSELYAI